MMPVTPIIVLALCGVAVLTGLALIAYQRIAEARALIAIPNDRSMHKSPQLIVGAGLAIMLIQIVVWWWLLATGSTMLAIPLVAALGLTILSYCDDISPVSPKLRLIAHMIAAFALLSVIFEAQWREAGLLGFALILIGTVCLAWWINAYNFMDGIDAITSVETLHLTFGFVVVIAMFGAVTPLTVAALSLAIGVAVFLIWNWPPAKMILGDSGSIPLGFMTAWLLAELVRQGFVAAALILPMYYLVDATGTLLKRMMTVPAFWRPHRQHAYQIAALKGARPANIVSRIAVLNLFLLLLALGSTALPWVCLVLAVAACVVFCGMLKKGPYASAST